MKRHHLFLLSLIVLAVLLAGCITVFEPVDTPTPPPTSIILPTNVPTLGTDLATIEPTLSQSVALCTVDPLISACAVPQVQERDRYCAEKIPYNQYAAAAGVTFDALDPGLICADQGIRNGEQVIACTGQSLYSYNLKICSASCTASALTVDASKCPDGYGYSPDAGCCWPMPTADAGCVIVKVNIGACK